MMWCVCDRSHHDLYACITLNRVVSALLDIELVTDDYLFLHAPLIAFIINDRIDMTCNNLNVACVCLDLARVNINASSSFRLC